MSDRAESAAQVDILDVGHGSCVVVRDQQEVVLIDAGPGGPLLEYLRGEGIKRVSAVVISHADTDHIGGLVALLGQSIPIGRILWNGDSVKQSTMWKDLVYLLDDLDRRGITSAQQDASEGLRIPLQSSGVELRLLAPSLILRRLGAGNTDREGRRIKTNSISVVIQVFVDGEPLILLPGDLDELGYLHLINGTEANALRSRYLVLPHHGGWLGTSTSTSETIAALVTAVEPELVFISNGRGRYGNPRREVVAAVRAVAPSGPISCTQLAESCAVNAIARGGPTSPYSAGWSRGFSCAGTVRLTSGNGIGAPYDRTSHARFLEVSVPQRLCKEPWEEGISPTAPAVS